MQLALLTHNLNSGLIPQVDIEYWQRISVDKINAEIDQVMNIPVCNMISKLYGFFRTGVATLSSAMYF